jgi:hypothetical protein
MAMVVVVAAVANGCNVRQSLGVHDPAPPGGEGNSVATRETAEDRYRQSTKYCAFAFSSDPLGRESCFGNARTRYAIESQEEMANRQMAGAASAELAGRCQKILTVLIQCGVIVPTRAAEYQPWCSDALSGRAPAQYGIALCVESSPSCEQVHACGRSQ